ncbi:hypothetical protein [Polyangium sp. 6x1]|uniref:hypothetical protein n=1 Tax=Polyangium sp. 6x1 TaxID=3042689 RepID=UPI002482AD9B|nr:hypothetical protein [Polyangium sp. 6x1]MDI1450158.1 hypothetical protein [Polyangium sp. 6x1]
MMLASLRRAPFQIVSLLALALGAFGGGCQSSSSETPQKGPGYTECGDVTCSPGQHCEQPSVSICEEGCLTDENCPTQQICDPNASTFRQCIGSSTTNPPPDSLAACKAACDHFQTCGLAADETAKCRTDCEGLTEDQRAAIANCGDTACSSLPSCLGVQCVSTNDCQNDQSCVGFTCLDGA